MNNKLLSKCTYFLIAFLAFFTLEKSVFGQPASPSWQVTCAGVAQNSKLNCQMSQSLLVEESRQRILSAAIFLDETELPMMRVQFPHGIDVLKPIVLRTDDKDLTEFPIRYGDSNGTYGIISLSIEMLDAMKKGKKLSFSVSAWQGGQLNLELSLTGFTAAFQLIRLTITD